MNWKKGDVFFVDYRKMEENGLPISDWKLWFPPEKQPFTVGSFYNRGVVTDGFSIRYLYIKPAKNQIVIDILKDL